MSDKTIVSIDIETLSTEPDGVILSIGACIVGTDKTFHYYCGIGRQLLDGRRVDRDTHDWWLSRPKKQFESEICNKDKTSFPKVLLYLSNFIADFCSSGDFLVYTKGYMDIYMLENAFRQYGLKVPWNFRQVRDLRTLMEDAKIDEKNLPFSNKNAHDALSDALYQGEIIELAREELGL